MFRLRRWAILGVNADPSIRRILPWSGGSVTMSIRPREAAVTAARSASSRIPALDRKVSGSLSMAVLSA